MSESKDRLADLRIDRRDDEDEGSPWLRRGLLLALALVLVALAWWWFLGRERPIEVEVAEVTAVREGRDAVSVLDASGYVTARRRATVSSKRTGKIVEVLVAEGDTVKAGDVIARSRSSVSRRAMTSPT